MLMQCIDSLVQKVQSGVVINFEKIGPDPPPIDGANNRDGTEQTDDLAHETDKDIDGEAERNGVSRIVFMTIMFLIFCKQKWNVFFSGLIYQFDY